MKKCTKCGVEKPLSEFNVRSDTKKLTGSCKLCISEYSKKQHLKNLIKRKDQKLKKQYGISFEEKLNMFNLQNKKCDICNTEFKNISAAHVDHCHKTGKIRGLLCTKCNPGIGYLQDSTDILKSAIKYLEKFIF
jgi:hypothetical protein